MTTLTKHQKKQFHRTADGMDITVTVRHDDECGNGHNTFSITVDAWKAGHRKTDKNWMMGGCCHDLVEAHFPELAPFIKWHLTSTDGPMHYVANTLYHASDTDYNGKRKGEPINPRTVLRFQDFPITYRGSQGFLKWLQGLENFDLEIMTVEHRDRGKPGEYQFGPKYTFLPYAAGEWHKCPFDSEQEAVQFLAALNRGPVEFVTECTGISEGKEPNLEAARNAAIWPDATLEQLRDKDLLEARLPGLLAEFRRDVESLGFTF